MLLGNGKNGPKSRTQNYAECNKTDLIKSEKTNGEDYNEKTLQRRCRRE